MPTSEPPTGARTLIQNGEPKEPILITQAGIQLSSVEQVWRVANLLYESQLVPASFKTPQQIVVALLRAIELGLPPLQALEGMSVVNNRVGLMGDLALSMVESSGLLELKRVEYSGETPESLSCTVTLKRRGREAQAYSFSVKEARAAGIYDRSATWRNYPPRRMVYYRALGFGLPDEFSDVLKGTKTVEELMDYPTEEPRSGRQRITRPAPLAKPRLASNGDVAPVPESAPESSERTPLAQVQERLEESRISEQEFVDILKFSRLPEAQSVSALRDVPTRLLIMALEGWPTIEELADELRERRAEAKS